MNDEHDTNTKDIFTKKEKRLKIPKGDFVRLHIEKIVKNGTIKTTASIDFHSYIFLAYKLEAVPFTREANKIIKNWITKKMNTDANYDKHAKYDFSMWLKKIILSEIVSRELKEKYWSDPYFFEG